MSDEFRLRAYSAELALSKAIERIAKLESELKHAKHMADKEYNRNMATQAENAKLREAAQALLVSCTEKPNRPQYRVVGRDEYEKLEAALEVNDESM
jgi:hypothetical protein